MALIDDTTWEFALRSGVTFSDGTPFTADDVAFTLRRVPKVPTTVADFSEYVKPIAASRWSIRIRSACTPTRHSRCCRIIWPRSASSRASTGEDAGTADYNTGNAAIGTGPFRFVSWARGDRMVMERNDHLLGRNARLGPVTFHYIRTRRRGWPRCWPAMSTLIDHGVGAGCRAGQARYRGSPSSPACRTTSSASCSTCATAAVAEDHRQRRQATGGKPIPRSPRAPGGRPRDRSRRDPRPRDERAVGAGQPDHAAGPISATIPTCRRCATIRPRQSVCWPRPAIPNGFHLTMDCQNDRFVNDATICQAMAQMLTRVGIATTPEVMPHAVWVPRANRHEFSLFTDVLDVRHAGARHRADQPVRDARSGARPRRVQPRRLQQSGIRRGAGTGADHDGRAMRAKNC